MVLVAIINPGNLDSKHSSMYTVNHYGCHTLLSHQTGKVAS